MLVKLASGVPIEILGDPHLGRQFVNGTPLHRRGDRERMQWTSFSTSLEAAKDADFHVNLGDIFDKFYVSYDVVMKAVRLYKQAAQQNPETRFVILKGNHDWSRDLERASAFDVFAEALAETSNVEIVSEGPVRFGRLAFFPWHPTVSQRAMVPGLKGCHTAFGHWDTQSYGGDDLNLIPARELVDAGFRQAFTGHEHRPTQKSIDGLDIQVVGSMQPYAHGENINDDLYVTLTRKEAEGRKDLHNKVVRVVLGAGEASDLDLDCLNLTYKRLAEDTKDEPDVNMGSDFDLEAIFVEAFKKAGVSDRVVQEVLRDFGSRRLSGAS